MDEVALAVGVGHIARTADHVEEVHDRLVVATLVRLGTDRRRLPLGDLRPRLLVAGADLFGVPHDVLCHRLPDGSVVVCCIGVYGVGG